jgi:predicted ABC-type ATPase
VDCVWRAGAKLVQGGRHIHRDAVDKRYRQALHKVLQAA